MALLPSVIVSHPQRDYGCHVTFIDIIVPETYSVLSRSRDFSFCELRISSENGPILRRLSFHPANNFVLIVCCVYYFSRSFCLLWNVFCRHRRRYEEIIIEIYTQKSQTEWASETRTAFYCLNFGFFSTESLLLFYKHTLSQRSWTFLDCVVRLYKAPTSQLLKTIECIFTWILKGLIYVSKAATWWWWCQGISFFFSVSKNTNFGHTKANRRPMIIRVVCIEGKKYFHFKWASME